MGARCCAGSDMMISPETGRYAAALDVMVLWLAAVDDTIRNCRQDKRRKMRSRA